MIHFYLLSYLQFKFQKMKIQENYDDDNDDDDLYLISLYLTG